MTRSEQFRKSRAWLKIHSFVITHSLRKKLENLPLEQRAGYCYIQNLVLIFADEYDKSFVHIPSVSWKEKLGTHYTRLIKQLEGWKELEIDRDYRWSNDKSGYSMSYAVPLLARESGTCIVDFQRKRIRLPRPKNKPTDLVSEYALECLFKLEVAKDLVYPPQEDPSKDSNTRKERIRHHCEHIGAGDFSLRYGRNVGRLYHRVLLMPKEGRCNLTYCFPLADYDIRTCHPFLLLKLFTDPIERAKYAEMLSGDIYTRIGQGMGINDRGQVKDDFQRVCNSRHKGSKWMAKQYVFQFYYIHFPQFAVEVIFRRTDLAAWLQNFEASLMVQKLGAYCREQGLFWIPMHDGFIARLDQGDAISVQASKIIQDEVGFAPHIKPTPLHP